MAKPVLVANWKNHPGSLDEAKSLLRDISRDSRFYKKLSLFIAPPLPYLELVSSRAGNFYKTAVQDIPLVSQGTHTGVITPDILKSFGVRLVILGHSERRALGETNAHVSLKVKIALRAGITVLVNYLEMKMANISNFCVTNCNFLFRVSRKLMLLK
jgi:triosephosphate isomerase (TIM)